MFENYKTFKSLSDINLLFLPLSCVGTLALSGHSVSGGISSDLSHEAEIGKEYLILNKIRNENKKDTSTTVISNPYKAEKTDMFLLSTGSLELPS